MSRLLLIKIGLLILLAGVCIICARNKTQKTSQIAQLVLGVLGFYAIASIVLLAVYAINHLNYPLQLEAMELTVLQHVKRLMSGLPLYTEPTADFVALAYNPLYYIISVPAVALVGANLPTLRLVSDVAMFGIAAVVFVAIRKNTSSSWWGLIAAGLFAAAYRVMDTYLDNAHSDGWMVFCAVLGCYLIDQKKSRVWNCVAVLILVMSFWFKQHGALFAIGGVLYLTWQNGLRKSIPYWIVAALFGPGLYTIAPLVMGPKFHYFTLEVPRQWTEFTPDTILRYLTIILGSYPVLAVTGIAFAGVALWQQRSKISVWYFLLPFAMLTGFLGSLDPGSNDNVFIAMGLWFIITGTLGLQWATKRYEVVERRALHLAAIGLSFIILLYDPTTVFAPAGASAAYQDLVSYLKSLDGPVYAPWLGQLESDYQLYPAAHWVPLEDMVRGPGKNETNNPLIRAVLDPVLNPSGKAYILVASTLDRDPLLGFLTEKYVLDTDLGQDRFWFSLSTIPKRFVIRGPRYLYRYDPAKAAAQAAGK